MRGLTLGEMGGYFLFLRAYFFLYFSLFAATSQLRVKHEGCVQRGRTVFMQLQIMTFKFKVIRV